MGSTTSVLTRVLKKPTVLEKVELESKNTANVFTVEEKNILKKTWAIVSNDMLGNGGRIVLKLFDLSSDTKSVMKCNFIDEKAMPCNGNFKMQSLRIMQVIDASIVNIDNMEKTMGPVLIELGRIHFCYQAFLPKYWNLVPEAVLHVWNEELGTGFGLQTRKIWSDLLLFLITNLRKDIIMRV